MSFKEERAQKFRTSIHNYCCNNFSVLANLSASTNAERTEMKYGQLLHAHKWWARREEQEEWSLETRAAGSFIISRVKFGLSYFPVVEEKKSSSFLLPSVFGAKKNGKSNGLWIIEQIVSVSNNKSSSMTCKYMFSHSSSSSLPLS